MNARKARIADLPKLVDVWKAFMNEHRAIVCEHEPRYESLYRLQPNAPRLIADYFRRMIHSKNARLAVAEDEGNEIVGYALGKIKKNIPVYAVSSLGELTDLYVEADHRGIGVGRRLMDAVDSWFQAKAMKWATVGVNAHNARARILYKKHGYFDFHIDMRKKV